MRVRVYYINLTRKKVDEEERVFVCLRYAKLV
jgi:hypothetical protein